MKHFTKEDQTKVNKKFDNFKKANVNTKDIIKIIEKTDEILEKSKSGKLADFFDDIKIMCKMVKAWFKGEYKEIPITTIGMIALTLLYIFAPIDIIPDCIPVAGLLDDASMVGLCIAAAKKDINDFKIWLKNK